MITVCNVKIRIKCIHTFKTGRHKRQADIILLLKYMSFMQYILTAKGDSQFSLSRPQFKFQAVFTTCFIFKHMKWLSIL